MTSQYSAQPSPGDRLGAAARALADAAVRTGADPAVLAEVAATVEELTARLAGSPPLARMHETPYHPMSLVGGTSHPLAPQLHTRPSGDGVAGTVVIGPSFEGGPGLVHGGIVSLLFDHAMGQAVFVAGYAAMTATLEVRYRAPTPLGVPLALAARVDRTEGRKVFVSARITAEGAVTAEASGVFVRLTADNVAQIFPAGRVPSGPPPAPAGG